MSAYSNNILAGMQIPGYPQSFNGGLPEVLAGLNAQLGIKNSQDIQLMTEFLQNETGKKIMSDVEKIRNTYMQEFNRFKQFKENPEMENLMKSAEESNKKIEELNDRISQLVSVALAQQEQLNSLTPKAAVVVEEPIVIKESKPTKAEKAS